MAGRFEVILSKYLNLKQHRKVYIIVLKIFQIIKIWNKAVIKKYHVVLPLKMNKNGKYT